MLALLRSERDLTYVFVAHHLTVLEPPYREAAFIAFAALRLLSRWQICAITTDIFAAVQVN